ncbi:Transient receptor potential cation channel subfamily M member 1 [Durusdinium trenchii]|uniref:Transient receptor potential cation channel subfamily M member 1 n=1 Tax=Durusdinium trenchii TaxID=1381693 RepID=A0ABP0HYV1_9DINO
MEENSENKPKEPKAKPKAKASGRKLQSKKGKEAQPALTSIIGNGEQPDREQGNQEITEVEASSENLNEDADNEALQLNITEDQSLSPPSHTIMRPKRPKEENLNRLRKLIKKLEDLEPRTTGPYFENEDDPELEPGNNDEAELETDEDQEDNEAYEDHERQTAAELFLKGGTERFRSLSSRDEKEVRMALCCMFYLRAELTLRRTSEFLIFLLGEARLRLEEDLEEGERLASMHGKVQQTAIVLVEKLRENDQEMLWCTKAGVCILVQFQLGDARLFFARPSLQQIMLDMWQGVRPDYFERNWCQQLRVWMRLLLFGSANLVMVPLFAVAPGVESYLQCKVILRADQTRQEEEDRWKRILKKQNNQWPYRFEKKGKVCWDKEDFEKAVREECREQVFQVQSRMPLLIPRYKKYLAILTNLGFAAYLIAERPEGANVPVVLVLSAGAWLGEVAQLVSFANAKAGARNSFLFWFMDRVNVMELVAFTCIAWTTVLVLIDKQSVEFAQQFKALGVLFLGISQSMAILRMSSVFGPLVSMTMNMIVDMIQWWMLLIPIIGCLVAALITLFKTQDTNLVLAV